MTVLLGCRPIRFCNLGHLTGIITLLVPNSITITRLPQDRETWASMTRQPPDARKNGPNVDSS